jgi:hypothetical protein
MIRSGSGKMAGVVLVVVSLWILRQKIQFNCSRIYYSATELTF